MSDTDDFSDEDSYPAAKQNGKRLSIERIYQKKTQLEHILLRPDTYIGSVEMETKVGLSLYISLAYPITSLFLANVGLGRGRWLRQNGVSRNLICPRIV